MQRRDRAPSLAVEYVPVKSLVPYERNSKKHPEYQIQQIVRSIQEFGDLDPIAAWHDPDGNAVIVEGHGRAMALERMGVEQAPVIFLDHLTDEQRRAYSHVHNQTTLNSGLDLDVLMADIDAMGNAYDWEALGFTVPDVDDYGTDFELSDVDAPQYKTATLNMTADQYCVFRSVVDAMDDPGGGGNVNANKVCEVLSQWAAR